MTLAITATLLEVAMMLPYLLAIGIMDAAKLPHPTHALVLAGYCLVMVAPALVLLVLRIVSGRLIEPLLQRVNNWFVEKGGETTAWIVGIAGFLIARAGLQGVGGFEALGEMLGR